MLQSDKEKVAEAMKRAGGKLMSPQLVSGASGVPQRRAMIALDELEADGLVEHAESSAVLLSQWLRYRWIGEDGQ